MCGIQDKAAQHRLLAEADLNLTKAMNLAQSMERAQKDIQSPRGSNVTLPREGTYSVVPKKQCYRCLGTGHAPTDCHFKSAKCNKCHKTGHIAKACQTRESTHKQIKQPLKSLSQKSQTTKAPMNIFEESPLFQSEPADIVHVDTASPHIPKSYKVLTTINNIPVTMELDTGAGVTIVSEKTWAEKLNSKTVN